ncbi:AAA family ATPase, partial [Bisgaard Taxon 45]
MYLNNIFIENMGAIDKFSLLEENMFLVNKNPKPIILLGQNGSGKTTLLSSIVDALYELSNSCFDDVLPKNGMGYSYFKLSGAINTKIGKDASLSYIRFCKDDNYFEYIDKQGELSEEALLEKTNNIISDDLKSSPKSKSINNNGKEKDFENDFRSNSYCYFPSDRYEIPYWMNRDVGYSKEKFREQEKFNKKLDREILVRKSLIEIKDWILNVFLDSRTNISINEYGSAYTSTPMNELMLLQRSITNIESLLSKILQKEIRIDLNYRGHGSSRIKIIDANTNETYIPSLDNLSAGQSTLLSIFGTIIQYSDNYDINKSKQLDLIEGIVVI